MSESVLAKIQIIPEPGQEHEIGGREVRDFKREHLEQLANIVDSAVEIFQERLANQTNNDENILTLEEINLSFGVDVQGNMGLSLGSIFSANAQKGTTFQVSIRLSKKG